MNIKKYLSAVTALLIIILLGTIVVNIFIANLTEVFGIIVNGLAVTFIILIIFSSIITYNVIKDKKVNPRLMSINFKIFSIIFPIVTSIGKVMGISKNEIRKVYVKLNNSYIYSQNYNVDSEDILILIPHCVQRNSCKFKVTTNINTCVQCGQCSIGDLAKLNEKSKVKIFVATGGTLARKIIMDNKPKAIIAVACERDLTSGVQDIKKIPVLGVFNKRPNGPCVDTNINIKDVEEAINFFTNKKIS